MGVNAKRHTDLRLQCTDDLADLMGQAAAVGIAQNHSFCATAGGSAQSLKRVGWVSFVTVKEMLGVIDDAAVLAA
ncbi:hypothetical protein SDC9_168581 [bioreactor metagenome]|uniref:Uncharacterized protein n=1 Tax=bioreactor metagenome TaxID=1076179 RepID=A0A645G5G8_9ZZZZ